jgi:hypothetical protein
MAIVEEIDEASRRSAHPVRSRFHGYLLRRGRQFWRLLLFTAVGLAFVAGAAEVYRGASLIGLPDVGDPFDVAQFRDFRIPPENDAFVLFRQARTKLSEMPHLPLAVRRLGPLSWSKSAPELREWVSANRDALEMFRAASKRPHGIPLPNPDRDDGDDGVDLGLFVELVRLEASRLEERGNMAGAWSWYRAVLRVQAHVTRRGAMWQRAVVDHYCVRMRPLIAAWAANPRTSAKQLRQALSDVKACEPKPESEAFSLKVDYLVMIHELDRKGGLIERGEVSDQQVRIGGQLLPPNLARTVYVTQRFLLNEPERSRRVLQLAYANWLAHVGEQDPGRLKAAVRAIFEIERQGASASFYPVRPDAPHAARALSPPQLAEWLVGAHDAKLLLAQWPWPEIRGSERRAYRDVVVLLASELFERERGSPPPTEQALVGPYLDRLPGDGSDDFDDGQTPTVRDHKTAPAAKDG